jgi:hypothetical protein
MDEPVIWGAWAAILLAPFLMVVAVLLYDATVRRRVSRRLDALWGWLGEGVRVVGSRREWQGEVEGRQVSVDWFDGTTEVRVAGQPRVRMGFAREEEPSDAMPETGLGRAYPIADGEVVWTEEPDRVPALVGQPGVREALRALLADDGESRRAVELSPTDGVGWLVRHLPDQRFGRADTERWVRALVRLARAAEAVPA